MNARSRFLTPRPAPRVELSPDLNRILASIGFLIREADRRDLAVTQYDIVKSLFLADRSHLNRFGRPITYDNYVAMNHGPVPSISYDLLKQYSPTMERVGIKSLPWTRKPADFVSVGCFQYTDSTICNEDDILSPSDMAALSEALTIISGLTFGQVRRLTHSDPAYKEAWGAATESNSIPMSLGLLFDEPNFEAAENLEFISRQQAENQSWDDDDAAFDLLKAG